MLTPRTSLARRVTAALDASPSRVPVLLGGCGSGRSTLLQQLRERTGRMSAQCIDIERTATTPERFYRAAIDRSPFPVTDASASGARAAFDVTLDFFSTSRTGAGEPAMFLLDEFLELRTFESFPGLRRVLYDFVARGYGALKAILEILGEDEGLTPTEISHRLQRTPGSTKDYLSWLEDVDLVAARQKRYSFTDPLLRVWVRLHCRASAPSEDDLAREVHRYAVPRLPQTTEPGTPPPTPAPQSEPAFAMAGSPSSGIIEID